MSQYAPGAVAELAGTRLPMGMPVGPLRVSAPARPAQLPVLRRRLRDWMAAVGVGEMDAVHVQLAASEAASNVVDHAYQGRDEPGPMWLTATADDGCVSVEVSDRGRWREPAAGQAEAVVAEPGRRGRGLKLIRACMDFVEFSHGRGTTVRMRRRLRRSGRADRGRSDRQPPPD